MNNKFQEIKEYLIKHLIECEDMVDIGNLIGHCIKNEEILYDFKSGINHGLQDLNKLPVYMKIVEGDHYE